MHFRRLNAREARFAPAKLEEFVLQMRCSQCGKEVAGVVAVARPRPRGMIPKNPDRGDRDGRTQVLAGTRRATASD